MIVDASSAPVAAPTKSLGERVAYARSKKATSAAPLTNGSANSKAQPKSATAVKGSEKAKKADKKKRNKSNRPKPKTIEELDAEMTDYMGGGPVAAGATQSNGAAQSAAANEDMGMDEISVGPTVPERNLHLTENYHSEIGLAYFQG